MTLSIKMPSSSKSLKTKLSGAIKSILPSSDGHFAYDSGWDDPVEDLPSGKQGDIHKDVSSETENVCPR